VRGARAARGGLTAATLRAEIDVFDRSLPCGAVVTRTAPAGGGRIEATFRLVAGPGGPCHGAASRPARPRLDAHTP
jgi:hypothetical protein